MHLPPGIVIMRQCCRTCHRYSSFVHWHLLDWLEYWGLTVIANTEFQDHRQTCRACADVCVKRSVWCSHLQSLLRMAAL